MDKIRIDGIAAYDGEYELDVSYFTMRELHTVKRLSGVRVGELEDALAAGDSDVIVALAVIALQRAGRQVVEDLIWDAPMGGITYVGDPDGADAVPPGLTPSGSLASGSGSGGSSGSGSDGSSDSPASDPSPTGRLLSDTGAA